MNTILLKTTFISVILGLKKVPSGLGGGRSRKRDFNVSRFLAFLVTFLLHFQRGRAFRACNSCWIIVLPTVDKATESLLSMLSGS
jgi:hypothetical protein